MSTYNNHIKYTPDFVYTPPSSLNAEKTSTMDETIDKYVCKFKTAFYGALFFAISVSYTHLTLPTSDLV